MFRTLILAAALVATWLVWSGMFKPLLLMLGAVSVGLVIWLAARMELTRREVFTLDLVGRMVGFWAWLLVEIVRANLAVTRIILSPRLPISPTMLRFKAPTTGPIGQATLANSITLTPGSLTVDAQDGDFRVHCLTRAGAQEVDSGAMAAGVVRALGER